MFPSKEAAVYVEHMGHWTGSSELHESIHRWAERWRYRCRGLPGPLKLIDLLERGLTWFARLFVEARRATYRTRYDHIRNG